MKTGDVTADAVHGVTKKYDRRLWMLPGDGVDRRIRRDPADGLFFSMFHSSYPPRTGYTVRLT